MKIYEPDEIRALRIGLRESRSKFADRFLLSAEAVKGWETGKRNISGPALIIMQQIQQIVEKKKTEQSEMLAKYREQIRVNN